jgi:signal transduction histidine kinase
MANLAPTLQATGARITHDPLPRVLVHKAHLHQLFQNLLGNALKYQKLHEPARISINAIRQGTMWRLSISDNGVGISPEYHEQIFGLFKRLGHDQPGTGIGLALCKKIVEQYQGSIWVESTLDAGATFHFTLPAATTESTNQATAGAQLPSRRSEAPRPLTAARH